MSCAALSVTHRIRCIAAAITCLIWWSGAARAERSGPQEDAVRWVPIAAGRFVMGCVPADRGCRGDERRHEVELSKRYELTATEVTIGQFDAFTRSTGGRTPTQPAWNRSSRHPVVNVTWAEAAAVCEWMGGRLPTEAEWERAARGGTDGTIYPWGDKYQRAHANAVGTGGADRWTGAAPVGSFPPNAYGLFDMAGNVWEWTADWYAPYARGAVSDPRGPASGARRVIRGGSWDSTPPRLRISMRASLPHDGRYNLYVGVRCAR